MPPIAFSELACLNPKGRLFFVLTLYLDESYNNRTMCLGGWLADSEKWAAIENAWNERLEYERRISVKKGQIPISRYHASDCASLQSEYRGWSRNRQILFAKRLLQI